MRKSILQLQNEIEFEFELLTLDLYKKLDDLENLVQ